MRVLSSPELMVLDGQAASLPVGDLVPYLSQTSQSTLTSDAQVINSINYRDTGVIMRVTPHVGSDGLVTLDLSQEVSGVSPDHHLHRQLTDLHRAHRHLARRDPGRPDHRPGRADLRQ